MDYLLLSLILTVFILLLFSAMFSAAETSLTSISISRINKLALQGNKKAAIVNSLHQKKKLVISTVLAGNTIVNIASSSLATAIFMKCFGPEGILASTITMTFLILLLSEALPKTYAIQNPEKVALLIAAPVMYCVFILSPLTTLIQYFVDVVLKIFRMHKDAEIISAADAMRNLILLHSTKGTMLKQDLDMLSSILDLAETEISQVMTHRKNLSALNIDTNVNDFIKQILKCHHSRIPIWKDREDIIIGILHVKDVVSLIREKNDSITQDDIYKIMTKPWFIPDTTLLSVQLHNFRKNRKHFALVIDEYGALQGIVTLEDILEEIVGDISDEHDITTENLIKSISENVYHISGEMPIRDINRQLRWNLPDEEASTLAGLIVYKIERIPEEGEKFQLYGFFFTILTKHGNVISVIQVEIPNDINNNCIHA
ncbi:HlyC/CorC family transporter [Candidatus Neoehrlichia procyonis]|uniref:Transporter associated domain protein n=1 Tax=Candidatus Neoehrlichia procyonis str. RAC413 TaxID=1359163 RepID=A0A0F3NRW2_9RICK|nr:CNNM domain-containing protein [Candidatus Neoehrlichia lotoris]KJV69614.1 transporter associated domain protein [Candidatus Neoehrlichia lotoris str. RAC413]